ncbi:MAG: 2-C-methyl-D-erythritol 4-phosphate cytidylyltransferase [Cytophagia bacterium]|nr:2-C-methyl-D-erythritol 4-phosphate cytidylyltransferase [Cytophagia bacterium]
MTRTIILMGAGTGERMGSYIPKQFIEIDSLPIIIHTYNKLKTVKNLDIIIVLPEKNYSKWKDYINNFIEERTVLVRGGITRNISVRNGINSIKVDEGFVGIHDGVRPFFTKTLIEKLFIEAEKKGNAIPFTNTINSIRKIDKDTNESKSVDRSSFVQIQTPQVFRIKEIKNILKEIDDINYSDEASLIEMGGTKVNLVLGEEQNIKITTKGDLNLF